MNELLNHPYLMALLIFWTAAALATIHGGKPAEKAFEMAARAPFCWACCIV